MRSELFRLVNDSQIFLNSIGSHIRHENQNLQAGNGASWHESENPSKRRSHNDHLRTCALYLNDVLKTASKAKKNSQSQKNNVRRTFPGAPRKTDNRSKHSSYSRPRTYAFRIPVPITNNRRREPHATSGVPDNRGKHFAS